MTLPSFNAEQSLYWSSRHYRASALVSAIGGIRPSLDPTQGGLSFAQTCAGCHYYKDIDTLVCDGCADACGGIVVQPQPQLPEAGACTDNGNDIANCNGRLTCGPCS